MKVVEAANLPKKRQRRPQELNDFMSNWRISRVGHAERLKQVIPQIPTDIWIMIFKEISDLESSVNFSKVMREIPESPNLHTLSMALGHFLFGESPAIQRVFSFNAEKRDALISLIREKLTYRVSISETEIEDTELRNEINQLINHSLQDMLPPEASTKLSFILDRLNFILQRTQSPPITTLPQHIDRYMTKIFVTGVIALSSIALICGSVGAAASSNDAAVWPLLIVGIILGAASLLVAFSERPEVRGLAAQLGDSMSQCFRNCRQPNTPSEQTPLLINENSEPRVVVLPDDFDERNDNNTYRNPDPLAKDDADAREALRKANRPG